MSLAAMGQHDINHNKVLATGEPASAVTGLGPFGPGDGDPNIALLLGEVAPTFGDRAESASDSGLGGDARVEGDEGDEGRVAVLAVAITLPDHVPAFA